MEDKEARLKKYLENLTKREKAVLGVAKRIIQSIYQFDLYCIALLNRSINLINGFVSLAEKDNYISAFALVRMHLDSLLRLYAFQLINENIDNVATEIENGRQISSYKCKFTNRRLTDSYLAEKLSEIDEFKWVHDVYDAGNSFIHLSDKHIITSVKKDYAKGVFSGFIGVGSSSIEIEEKIGSSIYMLKITDGIFAMLETWIVQKSSYEVSKNA